MAMEFVAASNSGLAGKCGTPMRGIRIANRNLPLTLGALPGGIPGQAPIRTISLFRIRHPNSAIRNQRAAACRRAPEPT
jgi:hypothetical protein